MFTRANEQGTIDFDAVDIDAVFIVVASADAVLGGHLVAVAHARLGCEELFDGAIARRDGFQAGEVKSAVACALVGDGLDFHFLELLVVFLEVDYLLDGMSVAVDGMALRLASHHAEDDGVAFEEGKRVPAIFARECADGGALDGDADPRRGCAVGSVDVAIDFARSILGSGGEGAEQQG